MEIETGEKWLFIGDSITDAERTGPFPAFGRGYVSFLRSMVMARHPERKMRFVNRGINGNTIRDLAARWESDVMAEKPDQVWVMIGINDIWRGFAESEQTEFHVPLEEFRETYEALIRRTLEGEGARIGLCGCFFVEPNREEPMRKMCDAYNAAAAELATRFSLPFVDMQALFDRLLRDQHPMTIAVDRVHPEPHGLMAMAEELYRYMEKEGSGT